jgi:hypothetical protein
VTTTTSRRWPRDTAATGCGVERWPVKTGTDADRSKVKTTTTVETTISYLRSRPKPSNSNRIATLELTCSRATSATLTRYKIEADGDIHLVVKTPQAAR